MSYLRALFSSKSLVWESSLIVKFGAASKSYNLQIILNVYVRKFSAIFLVSELWRDSSFGSWSLMMILF